MRDSRYRGGLFVGEDETLWRRIMNDSLNAAALQLRFEETHRFRLPSY